MNEIFLIEGKEMIITLPKTLEESKQEKIEKGMLSCLTFLFDEYLISIGLLTKNY